MNGIDIVSPDCKTRVLRKESLEEFLLDEQHVFPVQRDFRYDHIGAEIPDQVPAKTAQPLWVSLKIPADAAPGTYKGALKIEAAGQPPVTLPVEVEVIGWRVPNPQEFQTDGQFDLAKYQRWLASPGAAPYLQVLAAQYSDNIRRSKLLQAVTADVYVSDAALWQQFRDVNEMATIGLTAILPRNAVADSMVTVTPAEVAEYYKQHQVVFERPFLDLERQERRFLQLAEAPLIRVGDERQHPRTMIEGAGDHRRQVVFPRANPQALPNARQFARSEQFVARVV
jgi:hypothetical protein